VAVAVLELHKHEELYFLVGQQGENACIKSMGVLKEPGCGTDHDLDSPKKESATEGSAILATLTQPPLAPSNVVFAFVVVVAPAAALCVYLQNRRYSTAVLSMCLVSFISFQLVLFQFFFVD